MHLLKTYLLSEAVKWISADKTLEGPEAFQKDWNDTVDSGGTREDVATKWGINANLATQRAMWLGANGYRVKSFKHQRGNRAVVPEKGQEGPSKQGFFKQTKEINVNDIINKLKANEGDIGKTAKDLGLTYSTFYGQLALIKKKLPGLQLPIRAVGAMKKTNVPTPEEFQQVWNNAEDKVEAFQKLQEKWPHLSVEQLNRIYYKIVKFNDDFLTKFPDIRTSRRRLKFDNITSEPGSLSDDELDSIFGGSSEIQSSSNDQNDEFVSDEESNQEEDSPKLDLGLDDEVSEEQPEEENDFSESENELMSIWNASDSREEAMKKLKRLGWSNLAVKDARTKLKDKGVKFKKFDD